MQYSIIDNNRKPTPSSTRHNPDQFRRGVLAWSELEDVMGISSFKSSAHDDLTVRMSSKTPLPLRGNKYSQSNTKHWSYTEDPYAKYTSSSRAQRRGSFDSIDTGNSSLWSELTANTEGHSSAATGGVYESGSVVSEMSYASSSIIHGNSKMIMWEQNHPSSGGASTDSNSRGSDSKMKSRSNKKLRIRRFAKAIFGAVALLVLSGFAALSGSVIHSFVGEKYNLMYDRMPNGNLFGRLFTIRKGSNSNSQLKTKHQGGGQNLRLSYRKLPNGGSIVEMVPDLPSESGKDETSKEMAPKPSKLKRIFKRNGATSLKEKNRLEHLHKWRE